MEDIDVASCLDVTGLKGDGDEYALGVKEAQSQLRRLEWSKQAIFDEGMLLLVLCEGERDSHPFRAGVSPRISKSKASHALAKAASLARSLRAHVVGIQSVLDHLIGIAERQALSRQNINTGRLDRGITQATRNGLPLHAGHHSSDALAGSEGRDSMILPTLGIVDRPDSPLRVAEDTQAATAQLQSMAMEIPRSASPEGEFVGMEDAFSAPRRPLPQTATTINTISEREKVVSRERLPQAAASTAGMDTYQPSPNYRTREETPGLDSDEGLMPLLLFSMLADGRATRG